MPGGFVQPHASQLQCRPLDIIAVPALVEIERQGYSFPWSEEVFAGCFRPGYRVWGGDWMDDLVCFAVCQEVVDEVHILNLCVSPGFRGRGFGRRILRHARVDARRHGARKCLLEVRASNQAARALYEQEGFSQVGVRRGYYRSLNGKEDALVLAQDLG